MTAERASRLAIDTGGTFTDCVGVDPAGALRVEKVFSTPTDPSEAVQEGVRRLAEGVVDLVHGSTVATNALLERRGAQIVLVTTEGFEDLLSIGRQARPELYALVPQLPPPLVPRERCVGVPERMGPQGQVELALEAAAVEALVAQLRALSPDAIAVSLLHSYANPAHELALGEALQSLGVPVSLSSELLPEFREFERSATTALNAYVSPIMGRYLGRIAGGLPAESRLSIMQSNGGTVSAERASTEAARTLLSGPAGGVVGAARAAAQVGIERVITFDMGGTSTDVAAFVGEPEVTVDAQISGVPLRLPIVDIHTVGAGGGSLARIDAGGALRVGPQSAGAEPGPACYGRGGGPTVTDANLVLGRLAPRWFLDGQAELDLAAARSAIEAVVASTGMDVEAAARGILRVANATMARAIKAVSLGRGHDPRDFALVAFGGAGGMHACDLADELQIPKVLMPPLAGVLSALGMLQADRVKDASRTVLWPLDGTPIEQLESGAETLRAQLLTELDAELGGAPAELDTRLLCDLRYRGQSFEIPMRLGADLAQRFHRAHEAAFGYAIAEAEIEVVTLRARLAAKGRPLPEGALAPPAQPDAPEVGQERMATTDGWADATVWERGRLGAGQQFEGPALIVEPTATTVLTPGWRATMHLSGGLVLERVR